MAEFTKDFALIKNELLKDVFLKGVNEEKIKKYSAGYKELSLPCFAVYFFALKSELSSVKEIIENYVGDNDIVFTEGDDMGLIKFKDDEFNEYRSSKEYAGYLLRMIYDETGISLNAFVGTTEKSFFDIKRSYETAKSFAFPPKDGEGGKAYLYKEFAMETTLTELDEVSKNRLLTLLSNGEAEKVFSDYDLLETARNFLDNNMSISETARKTFIHRHTLTYRLDKIEHLTGLDLRIFDDAVAFNILTKLRNNK